MCRYVRIWNYQRFGRCTISPQRHTRPPLPAAGSATVKSSAIGVAVRRCITFHGLALNVNTDLSYFNRIIPCGLAWADVTSMENELSEAQSTERVRETFLHHFADVFGYSDTKESFGTLDLQAAQKGLSYEARDDR